MSNEEKSTLKNISLRLSEVETSILELKKMIQDSDINSYGEIKEELKNLTASFDSAFGIKTIINIPGSSGSKAGQ